MPDDDSTTTAPQLPEPNEPLPAAPDPDLFQIVEESDQGTSQGRIIGEMA